jgi:hypothetical protein
MRPVHSGPAWRPRCDRTNFPRSMVFPRRWVRQFSGMPQVGRSIPVLDRRHHRIESGRFAGRRNNWAARSLSPDSWALGWMPVTEEWGHEQTFSNSDAVNERQCHYLHPPSCAGCTYVPHRRYARYVSLRSGSLMMTSCTTYFGSETFAAAAPPAGDAEPCREERFPPGKFQPIDPRRAAT